MYIYEQKYLITLAQTNAAAFGYQSISGYYENMRLLPYGLMVVSNGSLYGVANLYSGQNVIGLKYTDMVFAQNVKEFFVKTYANNEESIGIINVQGTQVVSPRNYDDIQVLSDKQGLYLVEKDGEYGVLDRSGEVVVHCEYDSIGIPEDLLTTFKFSVEDNKYMLLDDKFVVQKIKNNKKYYILLDEVQMMKNFEDVLTIEFDDLELSNSMTRDVRAIVMKQEINGTIKFGLYDAESKKLVLPCSCERIYSITSKGKTEYYIEFQAQRIKLADQLAAYPDIFDKTN